MKKLWYVIISTCMVFSILSCEKDGTDSGDESKIIGTWVMYKAYEEWGDGDSELWYWDEDESDISIAVFEKGGEGMDIYYDLIDDDIDYMYFNWKIQDSKLIVNDGNGTHVASIKSLTDDELVVEIEEDGIFERRYCLRMEEDLY